MFGKNLLLGTFRDIDARTFPTPACIFASWDHVSSVLLN